MDEMFNVLMLRYICDMYKNIKASTIKAGCIMRYGGLAHSPVSRDVEYAFMKHYADRAAENESCTVEMVWNSFHEFAAGRKAEELHKNDGSFLTYADKVFISLVRLYRTAAEYMQHLKGWTDEKVAQTVLECMSEYYSEHWKSSKTPEEYFLGCLIAEDRGKLTA